MAPPRGVEKCSYKITVQFDQRIQIQDRNANSGNDHHLVGPIVDRHPRGRSPPDKGRNKANKKVDPNSRNRGCNSRPLASDNPNLRGIADKTGREIHQAERHFLNCGAEMLAD